MKTEYDFSKAEKGKFFKEDAEYNLPLYLDPDVKEFYENLAKKKKTDLNVIINKVLKNSIQYTKNMNL